MKVLYVETDLNPADDASHGHNAQGLIENSRWWTSPDFLWKPKEDHQLLHDAEPMHISFDDPEVRKILTTTTQIQERFALPGRLKYFSIWHKAKRAVAACLHFQKKFHVQPKEEGQVQTGEVRTSVSMTNQYDPVNTQELQNAEIEIIKAVQSEEFLEEISLLHSDNAQQGLKITL